MTLYSQSLAVTEAGSFHQLVNNVHVGVDAAVYSIFSQLGIISSINENILTSPDGLSEAKCSALQIMMEERN